MAEPVDVLDVNRMNRILRMALERTYLRALKERTPYKTGNLAGGWDISNPSPLVFEFVNPDGVIVLSLDEGSKEHIIKAQEGHYLKFKKGPRKSSYRPIPGNRAFESKGYIYAKMVRHPGFAARHFIREVFQDDVLFRQFSDTVTALLVEQAG
jgi:hypothetical protein